MAMRIRTGDVARRAAFVFRLEDLFCLVPAFPGNESA